MMHDIYIFGSLTRGEVFPNSDIDVLVIPLSADAGTYPHGWSVYQPPTLRRYFEAGNLFAWHLYLDARCIYSANATPFLLSLDRPSAYKDCRKDILSFRRILERSLQELCGGTDSTIFEAGLVYTALRDIAMSASWHLLERPDFSRHAPYHLPLPLPLSRESYEAVILARYWSTRGQACQFQSDELVRQLHAAPLMGWVDALEKML